VGDNLLLLVPALTESPVILHMYIPSWQGAVCLVCSNHILCDVNPDSRLQTADSRFQR